MTEKETRRSGHTDCHEPPQGGLRIVRSGVGLSRWHTLWDWLLAPESQDTAVAARADQSLGLDIDEAEDGEDKGGKG